MNVLRPGSKVLIHGEIPASVHGVTIRDFDGRLVAMYEIVWMKDASRCVEWLSVFEFVPVDEPSRVQIGFQQEKAA